MPLNLEDIERELKVIRIDLHQEFVSSFSLLQPILQYDEALNWAREGLSLARGAFGETQAAVEYFKVSPLMLRRLRFVQFSSWLRHGRILHQRSPALSAAFFRSSPAVLGALFVDEFEPWANAGSRLYHEAARSQWLAAQFFDAGPNLFGILLLEEVIALAALLEALSRHSPEAAGTYLDRSLSLLQTVDKRDRLALLQTGTVLAAEGANFVRGYLEAAPEVIARLRPAERIPYLKMVAHCSRGSGESGLRLFLEASKALAELDAGATVLILDTAVRLAQVAPVAAIDFVRMSPDLLAKLGPLQLEAWVRFGESVLAGNGRAGLAYFQLQSKRAQQKLHELSQVCEVDTVRQVLGMYCKGLTGRDLQVLAADELVNRGIGWRSSQVATTDGTSIFLPKIVAEFASREENFAFFKVLATHQAAHLEFGTFDFQFQGDSLLPTVSSPEGDPVLVTGNFERFFDLFSDRRLAKYLFLVLEDGRVDTHVMVHYPGIRRSYRGAQERALGRRPSPSRLPLRQACLEVLSQLSLGASATRIAVPAPLLSTIERTIDIVSDLWREGNTVEDSAKATIDLYDILAPIPNVHASMDSIVDGDGLALELVDDALASAVANQAELTLEAPEEIEYRGTLKPELIEALMKIRKDIPHPGEGEPVSPEALKRLLEKNGDIEIDLADEDVSAAMGLFVNNLLKEKGETADGERRSAHRESNTEATRNGKGLADGRPEADNVFRYDEWDFRAGDYRTGWCRLTEQRLPSGSPDPYQRILHENGEVVKATRRQFELLRPELFKKIKRLPDGEEFDLDELIEASIMKRSGHAPSEKIYWRRNKIQREVSFALLLDVSASTEEEIEGAALNNGGGGSPFVAKRKRIIDVEREAVVVLSEALEAIGDRYGIYAFSGYGRDGCEFYVVKDLDEGLSAAVKGRVENIAPVRGTRMGVAIRHAITKLEREESRLRILLLLSDGYPQDQDYYGTNRSERDYALQDTRVALLEAKKKLIVPFCLTVDRAGHDYLKTMCADIGYEIVNDIQSLPRRLPRLYRRLTT